MILVSLGLALAGPSGRAQRGADSGAFHATGRYLVTIAGKPAPTVVFERRQPWEWLVPLDQSCIRISLKPFVRAHLFPEPCATLTRDVPEDFNGDWLLVSVRKGRDVLVSIDGRKVMIAPRPPLLGLLDPRTVRGVFPEYAQGYAEFEPDAESIECIRASGARLDVKVYLGTWCGLSARYVPRVMKVIVALGDAVEKVSYYGIGAPVPEDPIAREATLAGVPMVAVQAASGPERRFYYKDLDRPAVAFAALVDGCSD